MSGICGVFCPRHPELANREILDMMLDAIGHRGPAARRFFSDETNGLGLGHVFAPVSQMPGEPQWHEDENHVALLDGALFNAQDFLPPQWRQHYKNRDTAAALEHLKQNPSDFPEKLDGNFGLAIWDKNERRLRIVRDALGGKPLYWCHLVEKGAVIFASELKGILVHPAVKRSVSREALTAYLTFGYIPAPLSIFENVYKVFHGEIVEMDSDARVMKRQFWHFPPYRPAPGDLQTFAAALREQVIQAVRRHAGSAERLGIFLSGGIDSTIVLAILNMLGVPTHTITLGFRTNPEKKHLDSDLYWAERSAQRFGSVHHAISIEPNHDPTLLLPRILRQFDEPMLTPNAYSKYFLSETAKNAGLHLCLTGCNAGVTFERMTQKSVEKARQKAGAGVSVDELVMINRTKLFSLEEQSELLVEPPPNARQSALSIVTRYGQDVEGEDLSDLIYGISMRMQGTEKSVTVLDRTAVLNGVEVRHPFYDTPLIQFANTIPARFKGSESEDMLKAVLRLAFEDILPAEISEREPTGYPSYYWTQGEVEHLKQYLLSPGGLKRTGLLRPDTVQQILEADKASKKKSAGKRTWGLLVLQAWYELYVNNNDDFFITRDY